MDKLIDFSSHLYKVGSRDAKKVASTAVAEKYEPLPTLDTRGFRRPGGGYAFVTEAPVEFSASSQQVAGFFPFCVGSSSPMIGVPLGRNLISGTTVTGDPISYYLQKLISAPSAMVMALNGRGKSSLVVRMALGIADAGFHCMALGDTKGEYRQVVQELGGQIIEVGPELDAVNPLDAGPLWERLPEIQAIDAAHGTRYAQQLMAQIHTRRLFTVQSLFKVSGDKTAKEVANDSMLLSLGIHEAAERAFAENPPRQPLLEDVRAVIIEGTPAMRRALLTETEEEYKVAAKPMIMALNLFDAEGPFGDVFARATTTPIRVDRSVDIDISAVRESQNRNLLAAVQMVCWSYGQAAIAAAKTLSKVGLMRESHYFLILDELWQILEADPQLVRYINEYTKLNRTIGLGQILITHSPKDLVFEDQELTSIAKGFIERSPMKFYGALAKNDMESLHDSMPMTLAEKNQLVAWSPEGVMDPVTRKVSPPIGRGKFLMKVGQGPGVPFQVTLTSSEHRIHDTNEAWAQAFEHAGTL
ncbi:hypothetical protein [Rothia sp. ZJ932]|uniref:hypothetical protein n=1 Tax=Rothia sp. ZJ932 TaxID=2810516 RepID=UPI0019689733|nr:hypothetical protein [Rothia sp. ZJ932]QRZ61793.1 hypothetical protein JR346_01225 [Rothia sp. ZJ932]